MTNGQDTPDKGTTHVPGGAERDDARLHQATQNGAQLKTYELFTSGIFRLIFSDYGWVQVTEIMEIKTSDEGGLLYT